MNHRVVLIIHARFSHEWWETAYKNLNSSCRNEDVMMALNHSLALTPDTYDILDDSNIMTLSGIVRYQTIIFACTEGSNCFAELQNFSEHL